MPRATALHFSATRAFALSLAAACLGSAHDLYLKPAQMTPAPGAAVVVEYHNGDSFPTSEGPAPIARLRDTKRLAAEGESPLSGLRAEGKATVAQFTAPAKGHFEIISRTIPNFIKLEPKKFEEYLGHEGLGYVIEWRNKNQESGKAGLELYSKYIKSLLRVSGPPSDSGYQPKPAGLTIEFVLLDDPYAAAPGAQLRAQLLFRGQPAANHEVELQALLDGGKVERKILGNTGADGAIRVPVPGPGFYKLHAIIMERLTPPRENADWESFWATLTFAVPARQ